MMLPHIFYRLSAVIALAVIALTQISRVLFQASTECAANVRCAAICRMVGVESRMNALEAVGFYS